MVIEMKIFLLKFTCWPPHLLGHLLMLEDPSVTGQIWKCGGWPGSLPLAAGAVGFVVPGWFCFCHLA